MSGGDDKPGFATAALHTKLPKSELDASLSVVPPIMLASTYEIADDFVLSSGTRTPVYGRYGNMTRNGLEDTMAKLEGAKGCMAFTCGMAASTAVVQALLKSGDHIVASKQMYGGNYHMFSKELPAFGLETTFVEAGTDPAAVAAAVTDRTRLVWLETCSNPLQELLDVKKMVAAVKAKKRDVVFAVDNTFLSPYILRPLEHGVDIVMHSGTKYIGGHSDLLMGFISTNDDDILAKVRHIQGTRGAVPSPYDCYLASRSLWTLEIRMQRHHSNALALARHLSAHPGVEKTIHPLLDSHPSKLVAEAQNGGVHSGMISFYVKGGEEAGKAFLSSLKIIPCAVSLGGVHSLAMAPQRTSHKFLSKEEQAATGITGGLIRFSVGLEDPKDLMRDLDQALLKATGLQSLKL